MSYFEGRRELGEAAHLAIDRAGGDLDGLLDQLERVDADATPSSDAIARFLQERGFELEWGIGGVPSALRAQIRHWNDDDMRKGLRHGHVALVTHLGHRLNGAESAGPHLAIGAVLGAGLGVAAALDTLYGTLSLLCVTGEDDLRILAEQGEFESPDCALTAYPSTTGSGFQHTIGQTGEHLAGMHISVRYPDSAGDSLHELHSAIGAIFDDVAAPDSLTATRDGFDLRSCAVTVIESIADRITALARARAESTGAPVVVDRSAVFVSMQPSRILARRIKTFAGSLKMQQDRVLKEPLGPPTAWGAVSQVTPTAIARFPIEPPGTSAGQGNARGQMCLMSKALASTGLDVLGDMEFRGFSEGELIRGLRERGIRREPRRWLGVHPVLPPKNPHAPTVNLPDVIVRGPGLPEPALDDLTSKDEE